MTMIPSHTQVILEKLARLDERVAAVQEDVRELKVQHRERLNLHSKRIGSLENTRARGRGAMAAMVFAVTLLGGDKAVQLAERYWNG